MSKQTKTIKQTRLRLIVKSLSVSGFMILFLSAMSWGGLLSIGKVAAMPTYTLVATHPQAVSQSTNFGKRIHTLQVFEGQIYSGYGDYDANTGPIHINPFNPATNTFSGSVLSVPTEQIGVFRNINGKLYAPLIDPNCGLNCPDIYASGTPWVNSVGPSVWHVYDMATLDGNDLWIAGSADEPFAGAHIWRSTDDGVTWNVVQSDTQNPTTGFERYYWLASLNGKMYAQASAIPDAPVRIFDGTSWTTGTTEFLAPHSMGITKVQVFADKIITRKNGLSAFDGTNIQTISGFSSGVKDIYKDGDNLYVLRNNNTLTRTTDLVSWQELGTVPVAALSVAVHEGYVYLGGTDSNIYRLNSKLPDENSSISITSPQNNATVSGVVEFTAEGFDVELQEISFNVENMRLDTVSSLPHTVNWDTAKLPNGNYKLKVSGTDVFSNTYTDEVVVTIDNPKTQSPTPIPTASEGDSSGVGTNMVALADANTGYPVFLRTPEDTELTCSNTFTEKLAEVQDRNYEYPQGLIEFCFNTEQIDNRVTITFVTSLPSDKLVVRKYNSDTNTYFTVKDAVIQETVYQGQPAVTVTYNIVDNQELDLDSAAGKIRDPIGIAVTDESGNLANTGRSQLHSTVPILIGISVMLVSLLKLYLHKQKNI